MLYVRTPLHGNEFKVCDEITDEVVAIFFNQQDAIDYVKIATVNSSRFDAEKHPKLLALAPEMLAILLDLRDGDYPLYGEAWMQIDRVIKKTGRDTE
jgi:hypothetical protein